MTSWYDDYLASMAVVNARPTPAVGACLTLRPTTFITWHKTGTMLTEMLRKILLSIVRLLFGPEGAILIGLAAVLYLLRE